MKRAIPLTLVCVLLLTASFAHAASKEGVTMPDSLTVGGKDLVLNGMGVREATMLSVDVYVAGLYLEKKSSDPGEILRTDQVRRLVLHFVRDVDKDDITDAWSEGFKKNAKNAGALSGKISTLNGFMADMEEGDAMVFNYVPEKGVTVIVKGREKGVIESKDFADAFFSIWLGDPPNKGLKTGLLGR